MANSGSYQTGGYGQPGGGAAYPPSNPPLSGGYPGSQSATGGYPGQPAAASGYPGQPAPSGYPGQPAAGGYPGQPAASGYPGQPAASGYPGQPAASGYPGYSAASGYPGQPAAGGYPGAQTAPGSSYPGQQGSGGYPQPGSGGYQSGPAGMPPGMDPTVYGWFMTVDADRSGKINMFELQQALTNSNWSHFNPETCRLMIGMFDRDQSGQIDINEFQALWTYITQWRGIFDQFDRDRSGAIDVNELQTAFTTMGYRVSPQFVQTVVNRFDPLARQRLTLDNFIQASVLLKTVTDTFKQKDAAMKGSIQVSYEEFLTMVVLNKPA